MGYVTGFVRCTPNLIFLGQALKKPPALLLVSMEHKSPITARRNNILFPVMSPPYYAPPREVFVFLDLIQMERMRRRAGRVLSIHIFEDWNIATALRAPLRHHSGVLSIFVLVPQRFVSTSNA